MDTGAPENDRVGALLSSYGSQEVVSKKWVPGGPKKWGPGSGRTRGKWLEALRISVIGAQTMEPGNNQIRAKQLGCSEKEGKRELK